MDTIILCSKALSKNQSDPNLSPTTPHHGQPRRLRLYTIYIYIYIQYVQCLILTLKWKTWFLGYKAVLSLMVSSLNVSVPFVDWFYGCPRNKGWKLPTRTKQLRIGRHFWTFNDVFDLTFERCGTVHKSRKAFKARPYCNVSNRSVGNDKKAVRRENMQGAPNWAMSTLD